MLEDDDPLKWAYAAHTEAKHRVLARYMKAWMPILAHAAKARRRRADLVIVDGFAGRGRYVGGEAGSPLILHSISCDMAESGVADETELFFVERDSENHAALSSAIDAQPAVPGVIVRTPIQAEFVTVAPGILDQLHRRPRPSFWFVDPFGFSGVPLALVRQILEPARSEIFITFMARDVNRFLDSPTHRVATGEMLGLQGRALDEVLADVHRSPYRVQALRDLYEKRLRELGGARYVWAFRVASGGAQDTIYYLVHASTHVKAFREMKDATFEIGGWQHSFLGRDDFATTGQAELPMFDTDIPALRQRLLEVFAGRELPYDPPTGSAESGLLNEAYPDRRFHMWIERHFHGALTELITQGTIHKTPVSTLGIRGLRGEDRIRFPLTRQLAL